LTFKIIQTDEKTDARIGKLRVNNKTIETPILFHGTILNGKPEPWKYFKERKIKTNIRGLMINAYEIIKAKKSQERIFKEGIHKYLSFDGIVFMDSGGFLIQKNQNFEIELEDIIEIYKKSFPDLKVTLDYPFSPLSTHNRNMKNWTTTLRNYERIYDVFPDAMPVIHGYTKKQIQKACKELQQYESDYIGIGSLVPLMRSIKGTKEIGRMSGFNHSKNYDTRRFIIDTIKYVRKKFPERLLHIFGIGSASTMHLMFSLGVDSIDSMGWRLKAAHGAVQIPFTADRFLSSLNGKRRNRPVFSNKEKEIFDDCECGIHEEFDYETIDTKFEPKAIHNAFVFLEENLQALKEIRKMNYFEFVSDRLKNTVYKSLFRYSQQKEQDRQTTLESSFA